MARCTRIWRDITISTWRMPGYRAMCVQGAAKGSDVPPSRAHIVCARRSKDATDARTSDTRISCHVRKDSDIVGAGRDSDSVLGYRGLGYRQLITCARRLTTSRPD